MRSSQPILLVENDQVDVMTIKRAFKDIGTDNDIIHFVNGENALAYLQGDNKNQPCIIILDLNMPRMNGIEFLEIVKSDRLLKRIPVVVLTTSKSEKDIADSFEHSIAGYMVKPADYEEFVTMLGTITNYWTISKLSNRS